MLWERRLGLEHGEATDLAFDGADTIAVSGHGSRAEDPGLQARLTLLSAADGSVLRRRAFEACDARAYPTCTHIKNECWGVAAVGEGAFAVACGTGIENCRRMTGTMLRDCRRNRPVAADPRPGAVPRSPAVWQVRGGAAGVGCVSPRPLAGPADVPCSPARPLGRATRSSSTGTASGSGGPA